MLPSIINSLHQKHFVPDDTNLGYGSSITQLPERVIGDTYNLVISRISGLDIILKLVGNGRFF